MTSCPYCGIGFHLTGCPRRRMKLVLEWAAVIAVLSVMVCCSFTAIRYEDPDCSKCADISKVTE